MDDVLHGGLAHETTGAIHMNIAVIGGVPQSLTTFRGELIKEIKNKGHNVCALAGGEEPHVTALLDSFGVKFVSYPIERTKLNPFSDLATLWFLYRWFKDNKIDMVFSYTAKPIIWGGLARRMAGVKYFHAMVTGLGRQFSFDSGKERLLSSFIARLYQLALVNADSVIFQNRDDQQFFIDQGITPETLTHRVNGSGVDLKHYTCSPLPDGPITFIAIGRLLAEKGFREYVQAAIEVSESYPEARFQIVGMKDNGKNAITERELETWSAHPNIEFLGKVDDSAISLSRCHVFVLATYLREGVPRTILEALAIGRPVITTDSVGCRDAITHGENGLLVEPRSVEELTTAMIELIANPQCLKKMAHNARRTAEERYDVVKVNAHMLQIMDL